VRRGDPVHHLPVQEAQKMEISTSTNAIPLAPVNDLVAEANHRAANSLALLGGLVRMQARAVGKNSQSYSNAEIRLLFDGIAARIATIGQLHRMLASIPAEGVFPLNTHLRDVCANLITAFSSEHQPVRIEYGGADCLVLTRHVQPLTLILCEILTNAMKYAHPAGVPVKMTVACDSRSDGTLILSIADDGVGLPEGFDPKTGGGIGFQIIRALASEIGALLDVQSDTLGVTFTLTVPQALVANVRTA
jgi:two-component sensor histidine kinase